MRVAIVGAKDRCTLEDKKLVEELIEKVSASHFDVLYVCTNTWTPGIGQFVRSKCLERAGSDFRFQVVLVDMRTYSSHCSRTEMADIFIARNAAIHELADVLYYFATSDRRGTIEDLVERMNRANRPVKVFLPGDPVEAI